VADGWSLDLLVEELRTLYGAAIERTVDALGTALEGVLPALPVQYADYALWQRGWLQGAALEEELTYWRERLTGAPTVELAPDFTRPAVPRYQGALLRFRLSKAVSSWVRSFGQQHQATPYMVLLAAFKVLVGRYTGQEDVVVGTDIVGRPEEALSGLVGFFVNTLVLRTAVGQAEEFGEVVSRVRETMLGAQQYGTVPFERVVEEVKPERDTSRHAFFQIMFAQFCRGGQILLPQNEATAEELSFAPYVSEATTSKFDLTFIVGESEEELYGSLEYDTDLYTASTAKRLLGHYKALLEALATDATGPVALLPISSFSDDASELSSVFVDEAASSSELSGLAAWNATERDYPLARTAAGLVAEQAAARPDAVALSEQGARPSHVTYGALMARAERLASGLATAPLAEAPLAAAPLAETVVGVAGVRSPELFAALLGVWRAGGAYVPLSLEDPAARWAEQVRDAGVQTVLATAGSRSAVAERVPPGVTVLSIEDLLGVSLPEASTTEAVPEGAAVPDGAAVAATWLADEAATDETARARRLAYILFTSGSTGRPKGAMVEQRGLVNHLLAKVDALALDPTAV
ncbi:MAG: condensation domain-containing protein, partial [Bacteroidota bacterium]